MEKTTFHWLKAKGIGKTSTDTPFTITHIIETGCHSAFSFANIAGEEILLGAESKINILNDLLAWEILTGENRNRGTVSNTPTTIPVGIFKYKHPPYPSGLSPDDYAVYAHLVTTPIRLIHLVSAKMSTQEYIEAQIRYTNISKDLSEIMPITTPTDLGTVFTNNIVTSLKAMVQAGLIHRNLTWHNITADGQILDYDTWVCLPKVLMTYGIKPRDEDIIFANDQQKYWQYLLHQIHNALCVIAPVFDISDYADYKWEELGTWIQQQDPIVYKAYKQCKCPRIILKC